MSLFGSVNNLFGGSSTTASPFANAATTTTQPTSGGLFSNTQPFGSLLESTTQGSVLLGASQPALQSSLFGGASAATAQTQANQTPQNSQKPQHSGAYFDSLLSKTKRQAEGETGLGELPSLQLGLGDLRQKLRKLGPNASDQGIDGKAHYLLAASGVEPGAAVRDLGALGLHGRVERPQGYATSELDVETYLANLQNKTTLSMIADGLERSARDFENFLEDNVTMEWEAQRKRIYEHFGIKSTEDGVRNAWASVTGKESHGGGFGRSRRAGSSLGAAATQGPRTSPKKASVLGRSILLTSVIGSPSRIGPHGTEFPDVQAASGGDRLDGLSGIGFMDERIRREKQSKLADTMRALNDARQRKRPYFICRDLAQLADKSGERHAHHVAQSYKALMEIVGEQTDQDQAPRPRKFARMYLDRNPHSPDAVAMRKQILKGANRHLEKRFWNEANALIAKHAQEARLGGRPDVVSKVKALIRVRRSMKMLTLDGVELQTVQGEFIWAIVYYLLRAGFVSEAAEYVNENQQLFRSVDRTFSGYMNSYASSEDRRLKRAMQERCASEHNQRVRNAPEGSVDPFRMACYKIVGRCDLNNRSLDGLYTDINDWIWLQFNLARESDRYAELAGDMYGLAELQAGIHDIGLKHFSHTAADDASGTFGMFFYLQVLSGMFEQAVAYLYPYSYVDAVHFAITLTYYGLLRPSDDALAGDLLTHSTRDQPQISFGRMLGYYTRDFRAADVAAAVEYLVLIGLNCGDGGSGEAEQPERHAALCHEALRELVLETREYSRLIGDVMPDGRRIRGLIEERGPLVALASEEGFIKTITSQAAAFADDNGRTTDAVLLYHLAGDFDTVMAIVGRALGEAVSLGTGQEPMRLMPVKPRASGLAALAEGAAGSSLSLAAIDDPVELASKMTAMYKGDNMFWQKVSDNNKQACEILLRMSEIKASVEAGQWAAALDKINQLDILPVRALGNPTKIRNYAAKFSTLPQPVASNVPSLAEWAVTCAVQQRGRHATGTLSGNEATARMLVDELKQMCLDLTTYTSQLRYRFPEYLHEQLARAAAE